MKHKKLLFGLGIPVAVLLVGAGWFFQVQALLPHQRIVLELPYRLNDTPTGMIPMGETIFHPKPQVPHGHPGVDFNWDTGEQHEIIASASGTVTKIKSVPTNPATVDIFVASGAYLIGYKELSKAADGLKVGKKLTTGDGVGVAGYTCDQQHCWSNVHWEFSSRSLLKDRFCPVSYFSSKSRNAIETLWANQKPEDFQNMKQQFPDICSGDYKGKVE